VNPPVKAPPKPKDLVGAAAAEWRRIVPLLLELGLLTELDRAALTLYCIAWGDVVLLTHQLRVDKEAARAAGEPRSARATGGRCHRGIARESIHMRLLRDAEVRRDRALAHFGLSPAQRARVTVSREIGEQLGLPGVGVDPVQSKLSRLHAVK
jgi:P27 family predicted phage terminase small subunit